ncbi:MAG TPA: ABC transporter permease subunit [Candidatus Dormibacteraeota bacterium]
MRLIGWMAWRLHRRALIGFGAGGFLLSFAYGGAYNQAAGTTDASRAAFGRTISLAAKQFAFLVPIPVHPETLGGYEQYKWLSSAVILFAIWAAVAAVGAARGDEERGLTEQWLASGLTRGRLLVARTAAFGLALLFVAVASVLGISAVAPLVHSDANVGGELLKAVSMTAGVLAAYGLVLLLAQLPAERQTATSFGVGILVLLLIVNGLADTIDSATWIGAVSPFHWMERTSSAAPGGSFDLLGTLGLAVAAAVFVAGAAAVFQRRDLGGGLIAWGRRTGVAGRVAAVNPLLRTPITEGLWEQRVGLLVWTFSTLVVGALMVSVSKSVSDALLSDPRLGAMFARAGAGSVYATMLGFIWFGFALLILAGYSVVQASRWAAQDQEGRVEMLLTAPVSRTMVVIDRAVEFATASLLVVAGGYVGVATELPRSGLGLDAGRVFTASALMWPFALAFGGLGVALASRWPRIAVPALAAFAVAEYVLGDLAPILGAPGWVANLSIFHLYGNPVASAPSWPPAFWMALVFVVGFGAALLLMRRRDLSSS